MQHRYARSYILFLAVHTCGGKCRRRHARWGYSNFSASLGMERRTGILRISRRSSATFRGKKRITSPSGDTPGKQAELFGFDREKWPTGLPFGDYWLGTERSKATAWHVFSINGEGVVTFAAKEDTHRALCVSQEWPK